MKKIKTISALILIVSIFLTSCGTTVIEPNTTVGTTEAPITEETSETTTEVTTTASPYPEFSFAGIKMGMTIEQVQKIIGQSPKVTDKDGKKYFINPFKGIDCLDKSIQKDVWFVFNKNGKLDEVQYKIDKSDNLLFENAIIFYYNRFGDYVETHDSVKNTIWRLNGVYLVLSTIDTTTFAVSFFEENTFQKEHANEYNQYLKIINQNTTKKAS